METYLIVLSVLFGGLAMYCIMKVARYVHDLNESLADLEKQLAEMKEQLKGKQLPFFVRDGLEEIKALENADLFDLGRMRLYLEEAMKTVDIAADRQEKMGAVYDTLRNHRKADGKGDGK